jgi:hypothetical protein
MIIVVLYYYRFMPNREEKLASGALLAGLAATGVNL